MLSFIVKKYLKDIFKPIFSIKMFPITETEVYFKAWPTSASYGSTAPVVALELKIQSGCFDQGGAPLVRTVAF